MREKSFTLKLGFSCNNNCLSCSQANKARLGDLGTEEVKSLLESGRGDGCSLLVLTGGEPTTRPDIIEICEFARGLGFKQIVLQTNGRMLCYMGFCRKLVEAGVNRYMFGICGPGAELHDFVSQCPGAFDQAIQGIKNLKELKQGITVNYIVNKLNYKGLPDAVELLVSLGVNKALFSFMSCMGNARKNIDLLLPRMSEVEPYIHSALDKASEAGLAARACGYPFCFLQDHELECEELYSPLRTIRDKESLCLDFDKMSRQTSKCKASKCGQCRFDFVCGGPEKAYVEKFGWSEFKPVPGRKVKSASEILKGNKLKQQAL